MGDFAEGTFVGICIVFAFLAWPAFSHLGNIAKELKLLRELFVKIWKEME
jgi:hypothetical protein